MATNRTGKNRPVQRTQAGRGTQPRRAPGPQGQNRAKTQPRKAPSLSPEEMRRREEQRRLAARRRREEKKRLAALRRLRRRQIFRASFALSLVFLCLYWCFVALSITNREKADKNNRELMLITEGERKEDKIIGKEEYVFDGVKYLPVTELSPYFTVSQFGDKKTRSFQLPDGQWATFYLGTEEGVINFIPVSLSAPSLVVDGDLYLPLDFYASKMNCCVFAEEAQGDADTLTVKKIDPGFYFFQMPTSTPVAKGSIPQVNQGQ